MQKEEEIIKAFNASHADAYATIDRNNMGQNKLLLVRGNRLVSKQIENSVTQRLIDAAYDELRSIRN